MGQQISRPDEVRQAIDMLSKSIDLLDLAGLGVLAARVHESRELLENWLATPSAIHAASKLARSHMAADGARAEPIKRT